MVRSGATACSGAYISKLPKSADDFAAMFPDVFERIFSTDPPVEPRVDVSEVMRLDASYNCRSSHETRPMVLSQLAASSHGESSQVMQAARQATSDADDIDITLNSPRRMSLPRQLPWSEASPCDNASPGDSQSLCSYGGSPSAAVDHIVAPTHVDAALAGGAGGAEPATISSTERLKAALKAKHEQTKVVKRPAACLDKEGEDNEGEDSEGECTDVSDKDGDSGVGMPCKEKAKTKPKAKLLKFSEPSYSVEWSRNHVLCRTGHRGPYIHVCIQHLCSGSTLLRHMYIRFYTALL
jgi:hypothetical protein